MKRHVTEVFDCFWDRAGGGVSSRLPILVPEELFRTNSVFDYPDKSRREWCNHSSYEHDPAYASTAPKQIHARNRIVCPNLPISRQTRNGVEYRNGDVGRGNFHAIWNYACVHRDLQFSMLCGQMANYLPLLFTGSCNTIQLCEIFFS